MPLTFTPILTRKGSSQRTINVDLNGVPFGQLWTFRNTKDTWHPWHAKPLTGEHQAFYNAAMSGGDLFKAKAYMNAQAKES